MRWALEKPLSLGEEVALRAARQVPYRVAVFGVWLAFFGSALLGYLLSAPFLHEYYSHHAPPAWGDHIPLALAEPQGSFLGEALRIFLNNATIFLLFYAIAWRWPYLSFWGVVLLAVKTGALAAPYGEIVYNAFRYTVVLLAVALVEFWAYAQAPMRRLWAGIGALAVGAWIEVLLIRYGV